MQNDGIKLIIWLLHEARPYLDRGTPLPNHGRELSAQIDHVLAQTIKDYTPPSPPSSGELELSELSEGERELLSERLGKEVDGRVAYGFAKGGKILLTNAPLTEVQLELEPVELGLELLVGAPVKSVPLVQIEKKVSFDYSVKDRRDRCPGCGVEGELVEETEAFRELACRRETCSFGGIWKIERRI